MIEQQERLAIAHIRLDGGTQPRASLNEEHVEELAQVLLDGGVLPPATVFHDGSAYWLADGFHRYHAVERIGQDTIAVDIRQGTRRDAVLWSVGANATHGLKRTKADIHRGVETLLSDPEWCTWSDREIARQCKVSPTTVGTIKAKRSLSNLDSEENTPYTPQIKQYITKHGTVATMNTSGIGHPSSPEIAHSPLAEHEAALSGYRGYDNWQEAQKWEEKQRKAVPTATFPGFAQWAQDNVALGLDVFGNVRNDEDEEEVIAKSARNAHVMRVMGSSESPEWYTPSEIIDTVQSFLVTIDLDPCSNSHDCPNVPAATLYTKEDDGLSKEWNGKVYLNPPYGTTISLWINKLIVEYESNRVQEAVALLPARVDTQWFAPLYSHLICIIRGRIQFENASYNAPFPCVLVYIGTRRDDFIQHFKQWGPIVERVG